jgi:hypothetical protein
VLSKRPGGSIVRSHLAADTIKQPISGVKITKIDNMVPNTPKTLPRNRITKAECSVLDRGYGSGKKFILIS